MVVNSYNICGLFDGDKCIYIGKTKRSSGQWFYGIKRSYSPIYSDIRKYMKENPDKIFEAKYIHKFKYKTCWFNAFDDYIDLYKPLFQSE